MSLDLSAAVEAGYRAWCDASSGYVHSDAMHEALRSETEVSRIRVAVAAAAPLIEAQVRAQVAAEIALLPYESMALTVASAQVGRGEEPTPNVAAVCVMALARIAGGTS